MLLDRNTFFIREQVGLLRLTDVYDILDATSHETIGVAKEEPPEWAKWIRLVMKKHHLPTTVNVYENENEPPIFSIHRPWVFLRSKIQVTDQTGASFGYFKSKLFSLGGGFHVYDNADQHMAEVKGDWKGWNFKLLTPDGRELGTVAKKWAGITKELFTSADNYVVSLADGAGGNNAVGVLLLAAGLAIDMVFKEAE